MLHIFGWLLWAFVLYIAVTWSYGVVAYLRRYGGVTYASIFQAMFAWIVAVVFLVFDWNKLHLIWLIPLVWVASLLLQDVAAARGSADAYPVLGVKWTWVGLKGYLLGTHMWLLDELGIRAQSPKPVAEAKAQEEPEWARQLPHHLRPTQIKIQHLERIRRKIKVSHEEFCWMILGHPATTRRVQYHLYEQLKREHPGLKNDELLAALVISRWQHCIAAGHDLFGLGQYESNEVDRKAQEIVRKARTVEGLVTLFTQEESKYAVPPDPEWQWARTAIDRILGEDTSRSG